VPQDESVILGRSRSSFRILATSNDIEVIMLGAELLRCFSTLEEPWICLWWLFHISLAMDSAMARLECHQRLPLAYPASQRLTRARCHEAVAGRRINKVLIRQWCEQFIANTSSTSEVRINLVLIHYPPQPFVLEEVVLWGFIHQLVEGGRLIGSKLKDLLRVR